MEVKTIEQKAKSYDEALEWMCSIYQSLKGAVPNLIEKAAKHFFELRLKVR